MKVALLLVSLSLSGCGIVVYKASQQCSQDKPCHSGMIKIYEW